MLSCFCGSTDFSQFQTKDYLYSAKNNFFYNVCKSCNSHYLKYDSTLGNNYNSDYYSLKKSKIIRVNYLRAIRFNSGSLLAKLLRFFKPLSVYDEYVSKYLSSNKVRVLDYGSGTSLYIDFLQKVNLISGDAYSFDPFSCDIKTLTDFNNIPFDNIDLIISNQVLEHITSPKEVIEKLYQYTNDNCTFIFSVPVVGDVLTMFQQYSYTLQAPDHISILSLHGWMKLLTSTQWKIKSIVEDRRSTPNYIKKSQAILTENSLVNTEIDFKKRLFQADNIIFHLGK